MVIAAKKSTAGIKGKASINNTTEEVNKMIDEINTWKRSKKSS